MVKRPTLEAGAAVGGCLLNRCAVERAINVLDGTAAPTGGDANLTQWMGEDDTVSNGFTVSTPRVEVQPVTFSQEVAAAGDETAARAQAAYVVAAIAVVRRVCCCGCRRRCMCCCRRCLGHQPGLPLLLMHSWVAGRAGRWQATAV